MSEVVATQSRCPLGHTHTHTETHEEDLEDDTADELSASFDHLKQGFDAFKLELQCRTDALEEQQQQLEKMRTAFEDEKQFIELMLPVNDITGESDAVINISVQGMVVCARRSTLCAVEGSVLAAKFSERWTVQQEEKDEHGNILIDNGEDIDPYCFGEILCWLRSKRLSLLLGKNDPVHQLHY